MSKLGKIVIDLGYVVDVENEEMVEEAKECFYEDLTNAAKFGELGSMMKIVDAPDANEGDIPEFLTEEV